MSKNLCAKTVKPEHAYEVYANADLSWIWYVLKKYQSPEAEAKNEYARWLTAVSSPMTYGSLEYGDSYAADIKGQAHLILNPLKPVVEARKAYQVDPDPFWQDTWRIGDGYDVMDAARDEGWREIAGWGKDGWDLGSWPLVIIFVRNKEGKFQVLEYVEGDVTMWSCPSRLMRQQIIDSLAFFHWKHTDKPWVRDFESTDNVPLDSELRGPYRS